MLYYWDYSQLYFNRYFWKSLKIKEIFVTITQAEVEHVYVYNNISMAGILQTWDNKIIQLEMKEREKHWLVKRFCYFRFFFFFFHNSAMIRHGDGDESSGIRSWIQNKIRSLQIIIWGDKMQAQEWMRQQFWKQKGWWKLEVHYSLYWKPNCGT